MDKISQRKKIRTQQHAQEKDTPREKNHKGKINGENGVGEIKVFLQAHQPTSSSQVTASVTIPTEVLVIRQTLQ